LYGSVRKQNTSDANIELEIRHVDGRFAMSLVMIKCPHTARPICTGIDVEVSEFDRMPDIPMVESCPVCGMDHSWKKQEAWLADYAGRPVTPAPTILRTWKRAP
jgi:hypothetical protein